MPGTPRFDLPKLTFAWSSNLQSVPGTGLGAKRKKVPVFQDREAITRRFGVLDQNKLPIRIPCTRNPTPHISWYTGICGLIYRAEPVSGRNSSPGLSRNTFLLRKSARKCPWLQSNVWRGGSGTESTNMKFDFV